MQDVSGRAFKCSIDLQFNLLVTPAYSIPKANFIAVPITTKYTFSFSLRQIHVPQFRRKCNKRTMTPEYQAMNLKQLKILAKSRGVTEVYKFKKQELIEILLQQKSPKSPQKRWRKSKQIISRTLAWIGAIHILQTIKRNLPS